MQKKFNGKFSVLIYPTENIYPRIGKWTAHCLNMAFIADGDTPEDSFSLLLELIDESLDVSKRLKTNPYKNPSREDWDKFDKSEELSFEFIHNVLLDTFGQESGYQTTQFIVKCTEKGVDSMIPNINLDEIFGTDVADKIRNVAQQQKSGMPNTDFDWGKFFDALNITNVQAIANIGL